MASTIKVPSKTGPPDDATTAGDGGSRAQAVPAEGGTSIRRPFAANGGGALGPYAATFRARPSTAPALRFMAQVQAALARFGAQRMHRALYAYARSLACRSLAELGATQQSYVRSLAEDDATEWSRFLAWGMRIGAGERLSPLPEPRNARHATPL